jgi:hypothetical protein
MAFAALASELAACTLDFARFEPSDANAAPSQPDASTGPMGENEAATPPSDGEPTDGAADTATAPDATEQEASCAIPPSCLDTAQTCAAACAQQEKQCSARCFGGSCRSNCTRTESSCQAKCTTACTTCVQDSGCGATSACAGASAGD